MYTRLRINLCRLITDRGYSDPPRKRLKKGIELISPYRRNNKERRCQGDRKLRRYKRRYKVERTFSWLGNCRRLMFQFIASVRDAWQ